MSWLWFLSRKEAHRHGIADFTQNLIFFSCLPWKPFYRKWSWTWHGTKKMRGGKASKNKEVYCCSLPRKKKTFLNDKRPYNFSFFSLLNFCKTNSHFHPKMRRRDFLPSRIPSFIFRHKNSILRPIFLCVSLGHPSVALCLKIPKKFSLSSL